MNERKLKAWIDAGVIDGDAAARIRAFEAEHARPLALWAVIGIGALAIGLGIVLVVAANWDDIPAMVRLGIHLGVLATALGFGWWQGDRLRQRNPWIEEALLFVIGALGLTFFAHLGQAYQTTSPLWQPLLTWLALLGPLLLLRGQSWLTALALMLAATVAAINYGTGHYSLSDGRWVAPEAREAAIVTSLPVLAAGLGAFLRLFPSRANLGLRIEQLGMIYGVGMVSLFTLIASFMGRSLDEQFELGPLGLRTVVLLVVAAMVLVAHRAVSGRAAAAVLCGAGFIVAFCAAAAGHPVFGAILFILLWTGIAAASIHGGWRATFQVAVAMVALRLIVLSFQLDDDLLGSGLGLIFSGVLILGVAWGAVKIARRFAPPRELPA